MAKLISLLVKVGALAFILLLPLKYMIQLQLLGGIWIIQTLPSVILGLYTRALHRWALLVGWAAGMVTGTWMAASLHFKSTIFPLHVGGHVFPVYAALYALLLNLAVTAVLSAVFHAAGLASGEDATRPADYERDTA